MKRITLLLLALLMTACGVEKVEAAVEQLPDIEKQIIKQRYMSKNYHYINDYNIYKYSLPMSASTYRKIRDRAFHKLYNMLVINK